MELHWSRSVLWIPIDFIPYYDHFLCSYLITNSWLFCLHVMSPHLINPKINGCATILWYMEPTDSKNKDSTFSFISVQWHYHSPIVQRTGSQFHSCKFGHASVLQSTWKNWSAGKGSVFISIHICGLLFCHRSRKQTQWPRARSVTCLTPTAPGGPCCLIMGSVRFHHGVNNFSRKTALHAALNSFFYYGKI